MPEAAFGPSRRDCFLEAAVGDSKRILWTGATGYVGGRLLPQLQEAGYRVGKKLVGSLRIPTVVSNDLAGTKSTVQPRGLTDAISRVLINEVEEIAATRWSDAVSPGGKPGSWGGARFGSRIVDSRAVQVSAAPDEAFDPIQRIGGDVGCSTGTGCGGCGGFSI
jgi:hypothetical protein